MHRLLWMGLLAATLSACTSGGNLPGHNHPEGAAADNAAPATAKGDVVWRLKVAGAT